MFSKFLRVTLDSRVMFVSVHKPFLGDFTFLPLSQGLDFMKLVNLTVLLIQFRYLAKFNTILTKKYFG